MNVNLYVIEDYRKKDDFTVRKNKPKTNPISSKGEIDAKCVFTKDYERNDIFAVQKNKPNSNPIKANFEPIPRPFSHPKALLFGKRQSLRNKKKP
jgi:hypothetical protein